MAENTIFEGVQNETPGSSQQTPVAPVQGVSALSPVQQPAPNVPSQPPSPRVLPIPPPPSGPAPSNPLSSRFSFSLLVKLLIGMVLLIGVGFLAVKLVGTYFNKPSNVPVTLTYWGLWEEKAVMQSIIADFEKEHQNIKVEYLKQDPKQYRDRLANRIPKGDGPDIFRLHNTWLPMLAKLMLPLSEDVIKKEDFQKWYYPTTKRDLVYSGGIYAVPLGIDTLSLFVNTDILQTAAVPVPKTWNDFVNAARSMTVKDDKGKIKTAGAALGAYDNITHASDIVSLLFIQNGTDLKKISTTSKNASDALTFYSIFALGDGGVWDADQDPSILAFSKGNLAMYFGYSWDIFYIEAKSKEAGAKLSYKVYPVPFTPGGKNISIASYWAEGISKESKHKKEAFLFLNFLTKKEVQQKLFSEAAKTRIFGEPYSRTDLASLLRDNELLYPFVQQAPDAVSSFFSSDTYDGDSGLNSRMNEYLHKAVNSVLDNTSPQSAVETLSQGVSQVLDQYGIQ